jgi:hypothetical protein
MEANRKTFEHLPAFILLCVGILYAVGFLVVTLHYAHWGIHRISQEMFKAEYIHIGALALMPPVALASLLICFGRFRALQQKKELRVKGTEDQRMSMPGELLILNLVIMLFLVVIIGPKSVLSRDEVRYTIVALPVCSILALCMVACYRAGEEKRRKAWKEKFETIPAAGRAAFGEHIQEDMRLSYNRLEILKWGLVLVAGVADGLVIYWMWPTLQLMFQHRAPALLQYILVSGIIGLFVERLVASLPGYQERAKRFVLVAAVCICIPLAYFDVLAFTYGVYPFIPVSRGGANYIEAERIQLQPAASPPQAASQSPPTNTVWLLMETESALFVALDSEDDAPKKWLDATVTPKVQIVHRSALNGWTCSVKKNP